MPTEQHEKCYGCYKDFEIDFTMKDGCPIYESRKEMLGEIVCGHLFEIRADEVKFLQGNPMLGSGATVVKMRAERGDITGDMSLFYKSLDEKCSSI